MHLAGHGQDVFASANLKKEGQLQTEIVSEKEMKRKLPRSNISMDGREDEDIS